MEKYELKTHIKKIIVDDFLLQYQLAKSANLSGFYYDLVGNIAKFDVLRVAYSLPNCSVEELCEKSLYIYFHKDE
jgi:hypothetical protein